MGFGVAEVEFLVAARSVGVSFDRTMMLGRQTINMRGDEFEVLAPGVRGGFAEPFLEYLGGNSVRSLDVSRFGGATDAHDLNEPLDAALVGRFSAVIDG